MHLGRSLLSVLALPAMLAAIVAASEGAQIPINRDDRQTGMAKTAKNARVRSGFEHHVADLDQADWHKPTASTQHRVRIYTLGSSPPGETLAIPSFSRLADLLSYLEEQPKTVQAPVDGQVLSTVTTTIRWTSYHTVTEMEPPAAAATSFDGFEYDIDNPTTLFTRLAAADDQPAHQELKRDELAELESDYSDSGDVSLPDSPYPTPSLDLVVLVVGSALLIVAAMALPIFIMSYCLALCSCFSSPDREAGTGPAAVAAQPQIEDGASELTDFSELKLSRFSSLAQDN